MRIKNTDNCCITCLFAKPDATERLFFCEKLNKATLMSFNCNSYKKKTSKYHNCRTEINGIKFQSKKEANRYIELKTLQKNKVINYFLMQVPFHFDAGVKYKIDFQVFWANGNVTYEDVKGMRTDVYKMKKKFVEFNYPITIKEL